MDNKVTITVLADERTSKKGLIAEHAWSVWLETSTRNVLFDVGQKGASVLNAKALGIDLSKCDTIVLSHGHYDHTGGLVEILKKAPDARIHAHPMALSERFALNDDGTSRMNGMPEACREFLANQDVN